MQVLSTILYILLFLVFLSVLIIIHELGHLAMAKAFNVYCLEYSIGMGPLIFKKKRKNGETQFSLRAIPFGGYVSMYGEGVELPDGVEIPESRSLNGIKWWKRAIILLAGVTMNALLALVFFFASNCFPQESLYRDAVNVSSSSLAYEAGMRDGDIFKLGDALVYHDDVSNVDKAFYLLDNQTTLDEDSDTYYATCLNFSSVTNFKQREFADVMFIYELKDDGVPNFDQFVDPSTYTTAHVNFSILQKGIEEEIVDHVVTVSIKTKEKAIEPFGLQIYYEKHMNSFGTIVKNTFIDFGNSSTELVKGIGNLLFKPQSWKDVGGIIAVGFETTSVLQNFGFGRFLYVWGFISVNLAIFNLLPFPGLDGWQLLVLIIETTTRKKIPEKVKNIVSLIGVGLLLLLMGVIVVKDLLFYVFKV